MKVACSIIISTVFFSKISLTSMNTWRLIKHDKADAFTNMAIDETLLRGTDAALRFYKWNPSAISIGYFEQASG